MHIVLPNTPIQVAALLLRISFGVSLLFVGISHLTDIESFQLVVSDGLDMFGFLASVYAYIHPLLLIFGGGLFVSGRFPTLSALVAGIPLCVIPMGMLFKTLFGLDLPDMMAAAINAWIWLIMYVIVIVLDGMREHASTHAHMHTHAQGIHLPHIG